MITLAVGVVVGIVFGGAFVLLWRLLRKRKLLRGLGKQLLLIRVPKTETRQGEKHDFKEDFKAFEQLLTTLTALKEPITFEVAVPHVGEEIHFYMAVPRHLRETVAKQVQGIWNDASVELVPDDYSIFNPHGFTAGAYLVLKENNALPLRTYADLETDTFAPLAGALAKVNEIGEGAVLQVVLRPGPRGKKKSFEHLLQALKKGESFKDAVKATSPFAAFWDVFKNKKKDSEEKTEPKIVDEDAVKALSQKLAKTLFEVNIRVAASAPSQFQADDLLEGITAAFHQFASPTRNEFKVAKVKNITKFATQLIWRTFENTYASLLTSEEIASFYRFPGASTETPHVKWLKAKEAPPPNNLPKEGTYLGESIFRGEKKPLYISEDDRRRHIYSIGQTGTGKSTLLGSMIIEDMKQGKGLALVDPHGELVETALEHVPPERRDDVIVFDPADLWRPLGLNMLDFNQNRPEEKTFIVNEMQGIFNKLFDPTSMGPMFEQYMRNALLLLMEDFPNEPATLIEVPRVFTDPEYRKRKLARIKNPIVIDFWEKEAVKAGGEASLANMTPYITSKFNNFISNDYMRPIIGQPKSAFNFREVMDSGKILLINLSKGRIGDINAGLLGMVMIGKILMAALSRVDIPDMQKRRDFYLYIDEFQNFTTDSIATILSEARKYRLSLTMAHQFIGQLTEKIRDAVFGNVGSEIVFRVGVQDAEFLVKQFEPTFNSSDLQNIDNLNAYAKVLINGETSKPFNFKVSTSSWEKGDKKLAEDLKEYSRTKFGADRQEIEAEIYKRLRE